MVQRPHATDHGFPLHARSQATVDEASPELSGRYVQLRDAYDAHALALSLARAEGDGTFRRSGAELFAVSAICDAALRVVDSFDASMIRGGLSALWRDARSTVGKANADRVREVVANEFVDTPTPDRDALRHLLVIWFCGENPAFDRYESLFDPRGVRTRSRFDALVAALGQPLRALSVGDGDRTLLDVLAEPFMEHPGDLRAQLRLIRERWGRWAELPDDALLSALDTLDEELRHRGLGPGASSRFGLGHGDEERFSQDVDWMAGLVLIAKNVKVWMHQLSQAHGRTVQRLDQIPGEALDALAERGVTGLWLIGLWERSKASRRIKQRCGNPDADASAYSLYDYEIASDLGGYAAYEVLRDRAAARRIRLAADMVPNHFGVDSKWVIEHPERFVQRDRPPFPSYTFDGPDLCDDDRVEVRIEDGYYERSDAAVVFERRDGHTGERRYIYHGNDGTSMPWNDTAQLDFLREDVREAVIDTILHVARMFPVIRFDAAMTLARKHVRRLWYPAPGHGGAIPSRAQSSLSDEAFDAAMPREFWQQVVERVAEEVPDTLLLAEAFWMMEGYFVRTLGMHRVYNSAFMHMTRDEKNAEYRGLIKETLAHDPEILKRFVNFMNNPDEETAIEQFGNGDKYFGVCTLMATLPGLPMLGHGQFEGFSEKYGMEFTKPSWDETADAALIERHVREITPLLRQRDRFAASHEFELYDVVAEGGHVCEDVFAYSNCADGWRGALVVYNNRFAEAEGTIHTSAPASRRLSDGSRVQRTRSLADALRLPDRDRTWIVLRDLVGARELLRRASTLHAEGLSVRLHAYERLVFNEIRHLEDTDGAIERVAERIGGAFVPSVDGELAQVRALARFGYLFAALDPGRTHRWWESRQRTAEAPIDVRALMEVEEDAARLVDAMAHPEETNDTTDGELVHQIEEIIASSLRWCDVRQQLARRVVDDEANGGCARVVAALDRIMWADPAAPIARALALTRAGRIIERARADSAVDTIDQWISSGAFGAALRSAYGSTPSRGDATDLAIATIELDSELEPEGNSANATGPTPLGAVIAQAVVDGETPISRALGVNEWRESRWFVAEGLTELLDLWLVSTALFATEGAAAAGRAAKDVEERAEAARYEVGAFKRLVFGAS